MPITDEKWVLTKLITSTIVTIGVFIALFYLIPNLIVLTIVYIALIISLKFLIESIGDWVFCKYTSKKEVRELVENSVVVGKKLSQSKIIATESNRNTTNV